MAPGGLAIMDWRESWVSLNQMLLGLIATAVLMAVFVTILAAQDAKRTQMQGNSCVARMWNAPVDINSPNPWQPACAVGAPDLQ
jgi:hypothetical protein